MTGKAAAGRRWDLTSGAFLALGVIALVIAAAAATLALRLLRRPAIDFSRLPEKVTELNYIMFRDEVLAVDKSVPLNRYPHEFFGYSGERLGYSENGTAAIFGIDVSAFQEDIDWTAVRADGVEFAMLRVGGRGYTEGVMYDDSKFAEYFDGAAANGIHIGVYFFSQALTPEEAREEARFVLEKIAGRDVTYPVVFDWEFAGDPIARTNDVTRQQVTDAALAFCGEVAAAGYTPMVYFNMTLGYHFYDLARIMQYDLWLAELDGFPTFHYNFQMLQYSHTGTVSGIPKEVDLNLSFVDFAA